MDVALLFCCKSSFNGYLTIVNDKHLDRARWSWNRAKGQRFLRGGKQRLWKYLKCHLPLSRSRNVVDIQNARAAVETKAVGRVKGSQVYAKSGLRLDIRDECVIAEKSR